MHFKFKKCPGNFANIRITLICKDMFMNIFSDYLNQQTIIYNLGEVEEHT